MWRGVHAAVREVSRDLTVVVISVQGAAKAYVQPAAMDSEDSDDDVQSEIDDEDVNKILIVTQTPPSRKKTGQGNRAGMHVSIGLP